MSVDVRAHMRYSVILVIEEYDDELPLFIGSLKEIFPRFSEMYEIILVSNGAGRAVSRQLAELSVEHESIRAFELGKRAPQAVALRAGFEESRGEIIVAGGSHQQITPESFAALLESLDEETDIVNSWRAERADSSFNRLQSRAYNTVVRKITGIQLEDLSSAIKVFRREVLEQTDLYANMYRFLPILAAQKGFRVKEVKCRHYHWRGKSGFVGLTEYVERLADIFTLYFLTRFARKPLRFFSLFGLLFLVLGLAIITYVFGERFLLGEWLGERPIFLVGMFLLVLGVQVASTGLLGEIIAFTHGRQRPQYTIETEI